ncbi:peptidase inhibitor family I36 protein [Streptomyces sp. NPDC001787]|uniref:peptidase inhibitor family I36 protein n=1 Tax=Streptomyces sp. NPDC001787 TaxID=3154523 RepID=UPI0033250CE2
MSPTANCYCAGVCLYLDHGFNDCGYDNGMIPAADENVPNLVSHGFDDQSSSVVNYTDHAVTLHKAYDYKGREVTLDPGRCLANLPSGWNGNGGHLMV